jgi:hypothetical protein
MSTNATPNLCSCGCCEGELPLNTITNRPGLDAVSYRLADYGVFLQRMIAGISSATIADGPNQGARPLAGLTARAPDDPVIALLDAWAIVADILSFYQERIANEGYLRTSTERRSVLELAREIGYELSPGVAASVYLQFTVEQIIGTAAASAAQSTSGPGGSPFNSGIVSISADSQVQSVPAPGGLPQTFETSADFQAHVEWNALMPRQVRRADLALSNGRLYLLGTTASFSTGASVMLDPSAVYLLNPPPQVEPAVQVFRPFPILLREIFFGKKPPAPPPIPAVEVNRIYLQGTKTSLKYGDRLLLVGRNNSGLIQTQTFVIRNVVAESAFARTYVDFTDNSTLPSFAAATLPTEVPQLGQIPFTQDNVTLHILQKTISEQDLQAFLKINGWDGAELLELVNNEPPDSSTTDGAFAFRATASFFGATAPKWKSLPDPSKSQRSDPYPLDWDAANGGVGRFIWTDSQGNTYPDADVHLERSFPQILPSSWMLLEASGVGSSVYQIARAVEKSLPDYNISGKTTGLALKQPSLSLNGLSAPSVVSWAANRLDIFAIGLNGALYHRWWDGTNWNGPENLGGEGLINSPSAVSWAANRLDIFAVGSTGNLYHWAWNGTNWSGPENRGGAGIVNSPSAVSWAPNRLDIFAINSRGYLVHWFWNGSGWGGPEYFGGANLVNSPSAVSWVSGRLDIFAIGSDHNLYHWWWQGSWGGPDNRGGGNFINSPSAVSWAPNRLDIFANGSDGNLYHTYWDGTKWGLGQNPEKIGGGNWVNSPSAVSWSANRLDIFSITSEGNLSHIYWGGGWGGPEDLGGGGNLIDSPSVASWAANRLDIFATGSLGRWIHKGWAPGWFGPEDLGNGSLTPYPVRTTTAYVQSEQLPLADFPVVDDIPSGTLNLMLNGMALGLQPGQPVALNGMRADAQSVVANEILTLQSISHIGGFTNLQFTSGLQFSYLRASVTISANVTLATHGSTVQEILGNGDASQPNQTFQLKRPPLTYVSAPAATGIASSLQIRVNDLEWKEAQTSYGLTSQDEDYVVRLADDGTPNVMFGDPAARLSTGQQNIRATYRTGIGLAGNVAAGAISMLQSRPPGLRGVTNPLPASGAADPQDLAQARTNAPLAVLTLDRIVSLDDYENFAQGFAGIGKAQAIAIWSGETRLVHLTIAAANGDAVDPTSQLFKTLIQAIQLAHDPVQQVIVASYQPMTFNLNAGILVDKPVYDFSIVRSQVVAALTNAFAFANRAFAQAVTAAEIITLIQSVPGVIASSLNQLSLSSIGPAPGEAPAFLPASPAQWVSGVIQPAQLILLNPLGATVTELNS